jgi:hypothetical protein
MINDIEKSPCFECVIHLRGLDKENPIYPCGECAARISYADRNYGMPARLFEEEIFFLWHDVIDNLYVYGAGLQITDIGGLK